MTVLQLVVEGQDDKYVIGHLLRERGITLEKPTVAGGVEHLLSKLPTYLKASYGAHAIVVDADVDINSRWQSLRHRLKESGYDNVPQAPPPDGLIVTAPGKAPAGVWIMPDNTLPGTLEHFVRQLVPEGDLLWGPRTESRRRDPGRRATLSLDRKGRNPHVACVAGRTGHRNGKRHHETLFRARLAVR